MGRRYLITGGAGFIGSNFIRYLLEHEAGAAITNLDLLTYAGVEATVRELDADPRHTFVRGDIGDAALVDGLVPGHDVVVNFAAETHVDRSITGPAVFLQTNVVAPGCCSTPLAATASPASSMFPPTRSTGRWPRALPARTPR
jgi:dTDP-glucose 4,6-dehydratase